MHEFPTFLQERKTKIQSLNTTSHLCFSLMAGSVGVRGTEGPLLRGDVGEDAQNVAELFYELGKH
jgi:hypothetical protein